MAPCRPFHFDCRGILLTSLLLCATTAHAQTFPYTAYVTDQQTYVRSGPGQRYYPTGQIPQGYAVEVYRHDDKGWCAVRPPAGSFSWVSSHQVRSSGPGVVEVIADRVVTRVGSQLSDSRSAVQVLLSLGEQLEVITGNQQDDPRWTRVAAPAGEFRWVAAAALSRQPPLEVTPQSPVSETTQASKTTWSRQTEDSPASQTETPNLFEHLRTQNSLQLKSQHAALHFNVPTTVGSYDSAPTSPMDSPNVEASTMQIIAGSPAELQLAQFQSRTTGLAPPALRQENQVALPAGAIPPAEVSQPRVRFEGFTSTSPGAVGDVEELELRLSQTVIQPAGQWELDALQQAANHLLSSTKAPAVRAQLREVQERIARFKQVQQQYNNPLPPPTPRVTSLAAPHSSEANVAPTPTASEIAFTGQTSEVLKRVKEDLQAAVDPFEKDDSAAAKQPLYAAAGLLKPVVSKRAEAPQYALVDERGKVVSFVTPTPDLNLKPYVGRRIGVHGTRGFMPEYRRTHVTAGRVTPIDGTIRR